MAHEAEDSRRIEVWVAMADHFLDTETRHNIPLTAMRCVEAGLSVAEVRDVWRYEVSPAVWPNGWSAAGEWEFWEREWLVGTIQEVRTTWTNRVPFLRWLLYRAQVHFTHGVGVAIERCVAALLAAEPAERDPMSKALAGLARHYFDFCPSDLAQMDSVACGWLRLLYPEPFHQIIAPATLPCEGSRADQRVRTALKWTKDDPYRR